MLRTAPFPHELGMPLRCSEWIPASAGMTMKEPIESLPNFAAVVAGHSTSDRVDRGRADRLWQSFMRAREHSGSLTSADNRQFC